MRRCRYWNRGFCREGEDCVFYHSEEDCERFMETGKCNSRICQKRHRRQCRYFKTNEGCHRNEKYKYLHSQQTKFSQAEKEEESEVLRKRETSFKCNQCNFRSDREVTLRKHVNTKHGESHGDESESLDNFISRLRLKEFSEEYRAYFEQNGFLEEKRYIERLVASFGVDCILDLE